MLRELLVSNLVIVERAALSPGEGLTAITGETGAGKSLLLDALDLVAGGRASAELVGPRGDACEITADFAVDAPRAALVQQACGIAASDGCFILRRRIRNDGRGQAWINDTPVTVTALRGAASQLIEIHAQDRARRLAEPAEQLAAIDAHGGLSAQADGYALAHRRVLDLLAESTRLAEGDRGSLRELEFLRFQRREFDALAPKAGEFPELEARHRLLSEAESWRGLCEEAGAALTDDDRSAARVVGRLARRLADAPSAALREAAGQLATAVELLQGAAATCAGAAESLHGDPGELATVEARLDAYHELMRKHGGDENALFAALTQIDTRIAELDGLDGRRAAVAADLAAAQSERDRLGAALAEARRRAFVPLAKDIHRHLADLGMPKAKVELHEDPAAPPSALGSTAMEMHVRTNPGMPGGPLAAVASGGETSRLLLALATALAARSGTPLVVFDEVDAGVGGRLGTFIGSKLARLASARSVLAVTHTPQVAAAAAAHYVVRKRQGTDRTTVEVAALNGPDRLAELAEMLGGGAPATAQAKALLAEARA
jgi:DNA repair protein RecN (Recombination protein N)